MFTVYIKTTHPSSSETSNRKSPAWLRKQSCDNKQAGLEIFYLPGYVYEPAILLAKDPV